MTVVLLRKLLRDTRWPLLVVCVILFAFSAFWVKIAQRVTTEIAPFFNGLAFASRINPKVLEQVVFKGPGKVSQAVLGGADVRFERPTDFLAVELLHPVVIILTSLWAVGRAGAAVAGELDRGTMELLLSQPVPRNRLILAHLLVDAIVIPAVCLSILAGTQFGLWVVGPFTVDYTPLDKLNLPVTIPKGPPELAVSAARQPWAVVVLAALMFALSGLTMFVSACGRNRWRAVGLAAVVGVVMFVANVVGQLWEGAAFVRPATVFYYYQPQRVWLNDDWLVEVGAASVSGVGVLLAVGVLGYFAALEVFTRRDLPAPL